MGLSLECVLRPASCPCSSSLQGRTEPWHREPGGLQVLPSPCPRVSGGLGWVPGGSHPGYCACREGRSAAAGARDPHSPGGTRESRAAPAATAGREVRTHVSTARRLGQSRDPDRDTPARASDRRLGPGWAPVPPLPPGSCGTGPGTQHSYRSRRPGSGTASRDGTAGFSAPTAAAGCAASGPAARAEPRVRAHPTTPGTEHSGDIPTFPPRHPAPTGPVATGAGPAP